MIDSAERETKTPQDIFSVRGAAGDGGKLLAAATPVLDRMLGLRKLQYYYDRRPPGCDPDQFLDWALGQLEVRIRVADADLERVPATGPAVVVANHPFGGIEGMILARLIRRRRSDVRVMANYMLGRIPEIRELFLLVDPFEVSGSVQRNLASMRQALRWLEKGGLLVVFPAGEVAHFDARARRVQDPPWNPAVARLAAHAKAPCVPVHFAGRNGIPFQTLGMIHAMLRTGMLARELLRRRGSTIELRIGNPVPARRLKECDSDSTAIGYLRTRVEILAERASAIQPRVTPEYARPIAEETPVEELEREVHALPPDRLLVDGDDQVVYLADAGEIPSVLREIGRLREISFRAVGEGTGRELDLDEYDPEYRHLFIWSRQDRQIVGAYRMGLTDRLLERGGVSALYTSTLFRYDRRLFEAMGPGLEMGRSFVRPECQRGYASLLLLWKGIGTFVVRNPQYATLFGPVSISADYQSASQRLIVSFLRQNRYVHPWSRHVRPRTPHRPDRIAARTLSPAQLRDLDDVSGFISEIEADNKGVPILLKQYLRLNGRLLGFNVDPAFSNVLDVLIAVDLRDTEPKTLGRYLGRPGLASFYAHHALDHQLP